METSSSREIQTVISEEEMIELPAIDLQEGAMSEAEIVALIMKNVTTLGFFTLKNLKGFEEEKLFEAIRAFYAISSEEKHMLATNHHNKAN